VFSPLWELSSIPLELFMEKNIVFCHKGNLENLLVLFLEKIPCFGSDLDLGISGIVLVKLY
jgi:hypothetical protein